MFFSLKAESGTSAFCQKCAHPHAFTTKHQFIYLLETLPEHFPSCTTASSPSDCASVWTKIRCQDVCGSQQQAFVLLLQGAEVSDRDKKLSGRRPVWNILSKTFFFLSEFFWKYFLRHYYIGGIQSLIHWKTPQTGDFLYKNMSKWDIFFEKMSHFDM